MLFALLFHVFSERSGILQPQSALATERKAQIEMYHIVIRRVPQPQHTEREENIGKETCYCILFPKAGELSSATAVAAGGAAAATAPGEDDGLRCGGLG